MSKIQAICDRLGNIAFLIAIPLVFAWAVGVPFAHVAFWVFVGGSIILNTTSLIMSKLQEHSSLREVVCWLGREFGIFLAFMLVVVVVEITCHGFGVTGAWSYVVILIAGITISLVSLYRVLVSLYRVWLYQRMLIIALNTVNKWCNFPFVNGRLLQVSFAFDLKIATRLINSFPEKQRQYQLRELLHEFRKQGVPHTIKHTTEDGLLWAEHFDGRHTEVVTRWNMPEPLADQAFSEKLNTYIADHGPVAASDFAQVCRELGYPVPDPDEEI